MSQRGGSLSVCAVGYVVCKAARVAGVSGVHPHAIRRALASHLVAAGVNVRAVQVFLGHASLATTQLYLEVERVALRETVALLEREPKPILRRTPKGSDETVRRGS